MEVILKYFPGLSQQQINSFKKLQSLYTEWNGKINVISRKDIDNLYINHVLHSLAIAKVICFADQTSLLDVGTGGGFPGIPLAILFPNCNFHLIDSIGKKISVVNEVTTALKLTNIKGQHIRVEQLKDRYDFVISRAVTRFDDFFKMTEKNIHTQNKNSIGNGILYLKGGDFGDELKTIKNPVTIYSITDYFEEPFFETKKVIHVKIKA
jgi:16S rRNA (guanine527-N7)-methyltransferase